MVKQTICLPGRLRLRLEFLVQPTPDCPVCGVSGLTLYHGLRDRLYDTPGRWNLKRCWCGHVWLDPMPRETEITHADENYYTHHDPSAPSPLQRVYRTLLRLTPLHRERARLNLMYLNHVQPGCLLEVGCGAGDRLAQFRDRGWQVEGVEIDPTAATRARKRFGLKIHGALPAGDFDAVIMNHVIEHVPDPVTLLADCRRLLKPRGTLTATTPNIDSRGHRRFGASWMALDPPRHLHLFSVNSLRAVTRKAGFMQVQVWTTGARAVGIGLRSLAIPRDGRYNLRVRPRLADALRAVLFQLRATDEECVLKAIK